MSRKYSILQSVPIDDMYQQWEGQFEEWFADVKSQLSGDVAGNLLHRIEMVEDRVKTVEVEEYDSGNWHIRKHPNGFVEMWYHEYLPSKTTFTSSSSSPWNGKSYALPVILKRKLYQSSRCMFAYYWDTNPYPQYDLTIEGSTYSFPVPYILKENRKIPFIDEWELNNTGAWYYRFSSSIGNQVRCEIYITVVGLWK